MKHLYLFGLLFLVSCFRDSAFHQEVVKLQIELSNVSHPLLKSASIKVKEIQLKARKEGFEKTYIIGKNIGVINFDDLQITSGYKISDLLLESGLDVRSVVLVLDRDGNTLVKNDRTMCKHVTSPKPTELEVKIPDGMKLKPGHDYIITMDFDAPESIYLLAGDCHFTPRIVMRPVMRSIANIDLGPDLAEQNGEEKDPKDDTETLED
jgi:hypothetical protein